MTEVSPDVSDAAVSGPLDLSLLGVTFPLAISLAGLAGAVYLAARRDTTWWRRLGVRHPRTYPTFVDISGQDEPSLGDHARTVGAAFGGDEARFRAVNPRDLLATGRFPASLAVIATGAQDSEYLPGALRVAASARAAGMQVHYLEPPGAHSWTVAVAALRAALPLITPALGLPDA